MKAHIKISTVYLVSTFFILAESVCDEKTEKEKKKALANGLKKGTNKSENFTAIFSFYFCMI